MTVAITYWPVLPLAKQTVNLYASGTTGNLLEFFIDAAPAGSKIVPGRIVNYGQSFVPDVPGVYSFTVNDWTRVYKSPGFIGDPNAAPTLTLSASVQNQQVQVGQVVTRTIGIDPDLIDVLFIVQGSNIAAGALTNARSKSADVAARDSGVLLALQACISNTGGTVSAAGLDDPLQTKVNNLRAKYEAHRVIVSGAPAIHAAADAYNKVVRNRDSTSDEGSIALLNDIRIQISNHMLNQVNGATNPHTNPDSTNLIRAGAAFDKRSAHALADNTWSIYESHRVTVGGVAVHGSADNTDSLSAQKPLAALQSAFITAAYNASLSAPQGQHSATVTLVNAHGFKT